MERKLRLLRLGIVKRFARLMRVPFDPYRALWRWDDESTYPRCSGNLSKASAANAALSAQTYETLGRLGK